MSNSEATIDDSPSAPVSRLKHGIAGAVFIVIVAVGCWLVIGYGNADPSIQLQTALAKLDQPDDPIAWESARRLASKLKSSGVRDPDFPGAAEFILGVVATRVDESDPDRSRRMATAVKLLRDADRYGLAESRRPEWTFALGESLFETGQLQAARPLLEEAWISFPPGMIRSGLALAEIELSDPEQDSVKFAPAILERIGSQANLPSEDQRQVIALRTKLALRTGRLDAAEAELNRLEDGSGDANLSLMKADLCLAKGQLDEARRWLLPLAFPETPDHPPALIAAAAYRLGRCDELRGDAMSAARAFEKAAGVDPRSTDGTAGALDAARLFQQAGRDEEALTLFRLAVESQTEADPKPLSSDRFRDAVRAGCDVWITREAFEPAIALAKLAEPVLGPVESLDWQARGCERHAGRIESLWTEANETRRAEIEPERLERWRNSGAAYRNLATKVTDSSRVGEALWTAADHFRRGQAFQDAYEALTEVLEFRLPKMEAAALVRRGRAQLDLGRPLAAAEDFQKVLDEYPTDPEAFGARLLLGRCYLDGGDTAKAESVWRDLLALHELTPQASEWRLALFSLAESLYRRGIAALAEADLDSSIGKSWAASAVLPLDEAIVSFDEFLRRAPDAEQAVEARVLRADAMRRRADLAQRRAAIAETENLREADRREAERLLVEAIGELRKAQDALVPLADRDRLPQVGKQLLKATFFDLGHTYAALRRDREAIIAYGGAVNRYPDDPRVVTAYLRMAECHRRLGRPDDARAAIEQARLTLEQVPTAALGGSASALTRDEWQNWLTRLHDESTVAEGQ
ncbi:MAG: tetratricopeptide repeat protein [Planctomycetaceae bacterium]|nr:tetratricopeptide repeat protein [Planctomycetaceae bacterium]